MKRHILAFTIVLLLVLLVAFSACSKTDVRGNDYDRGMTQAELDNFEFKYVGTDITVSKFKDKSVETVVIPEGVTKIGPWAFSQFPNLRYVKLPSTLTEIFTEAFYDCKQLRYITLPESLKTIHKQAISCAVASIVIPAGVETIEQGAFDSCYKLVEICNKSAVDMDRVIDKSGSSFQTPSVLHIYSEGESYVKKHGSFVTYEDGDKRLLVDFDGDDAIVNIPNGITEIGDYAFWGKSNVTKIVVPNTVNKIGMAFDGCSSLREIVLPNSVTELGRFYGTAIKSIVIPDGVTVFVDSMFQKCLELESITYPPHLTSIGNSVFDGCTFENIVIPEGVERIGAQAFSQCENLVSVSLPSTLTEFGGWLFYKSTKFTTVNFAGTKSQWETIKKGMNWDLTLTLGNKQVKVVCSDGVID